MQHLSVENFLYFGCECLLVAELLHTQLLEVVLAQLGQVFSHDVILNKLPTVLSQTNVSQPLTNVVCRPFHGCPRLVSHTCSFLSLQLVITLSGNDPERFTGSVFFPLNFPHPFCIIVSCKRVGRVYIQSPLGGTSKVPDAVIMLK